MGAVQVSGYHTSTSDARIGPTTVGGLNMSAPLLGLGSSQSTQIAVIAGAVLLAAILLKGRKK